jgi:hypothetical protein
LTSRLEDVWKMFMKWEHALISADKLQKLVNICANYETPCKLLSVWHTEKHELSIKYVFRNISLRTDFKNVANSHGTCTQPTAC